MKDEFGKDLEGSSRELVGMLSWNLPGNTEENHENPQSG
jgi:hypothetical protein